MTTKRSLRFLAFAAFIIVLVGGVVPSERAAAQTNSEALIDVAKERFALGTAVNEIGYQMLHSSVLGTAVVLRMTTLVPWGEDEDSGSSFGGSIGAYGRYVVGGDDHEIRLFALGNLAGIQPPSGYDSEGDGSIGDYNTDYGFAVGADFYYRGIAGIGVAYAFEDICAEPDGARCQQRSGGHRVIVRPAVPAVGIFSQAAADLDDGAFSHLHLGWSRRYQDWDRTFLFAPVVAYEILGGITDPTGHYLLATDDAWVNFGGGDNTHFGIPATVRIGLDRRAGTFVSGGLAYISDDPAPDVRDGRRFGVVRATVSMYDAGIRKLPGFRIRIDLAPGLSPELPRIGLNVRLNQREDLDRTPLAEGIWAGGFTLNWYLDPHPLSD